MLSRSTLLSLAPGWCVCASETSVAWTWYFKYLGLCAIQISILFFITSHPGLKRTTATSCSWLTPAGVLAAGRGQMLAPDFRHLLPGSTAFVGYLQARTGAAFPAGEGSSVPTCCLLETCALAMRSCKSKHCWSFLSPDSHLGQQNAASPTETGGSDCHQTAIKSFGRLSGWQRMIYWDTCPGPSQTEPTDASRSLFRSSLNAAQSILPALTASSASAAGVELLGSSVWRHNPEPQWAPRLTSAALGVQWFCGIPVSSIPYMLSKSPLGQTCSFASGSANFVFRIFWAKQRKKKVYHLKEWGLFFFAVLESRCSECFPSGLLTSPWEGHARCTHHSPQILRRCGQALKPHSEVSSVQ